MPTFKTSDELFWWMGPNLFFSLPGNPKEERVEGRSPRPYAVPRQAVTVGLFRGVQSNSVHDALTFFFIFK